MTKYENLISNGPHRKTTLASLDSIRYRFALANYRDEAIYITGGSYSLLDNVSSVMRFNLRSNQWEKAPSMNQARKCHSSCVLKKKVYVFGGLS